MNINEKIWHRFYGKKGNYVVISFACGSEILGRLHIEEDELNKIVDFTYDQAQRRIKKYFRTKSDSTFDLFIHEKDIKCYSAIKILINSK